MSALAGTLSSNPKEGARFRARATYFFDYVMKTLPAMATAMYTRPLVLLLTNGYAHTHLVTHRFELRAADDARAFPPETPFVPQRQAVLRRLQAVVAIGALVLLGALVFLLVR